MNLQELKMKKPPELLAFAEEQGVEGAAQMRRQELMFSILKSQAENGRGYFLTGDDMTWFYHQYLPALGDDSEPEAGLAYAEANLAYANVNRVASAVVATAEFDPLRDEGAAYADRLKNSGVPTEYVPGPGLIHGYAAFLGVVDAADSTATEAMEIFGRMLRG